MGTPSKKNTAGTVCWSSGIGRRAAPSAAGSRGGCWEKKTEFVDELEKTIAAYKRSGDLEEAGKWSRSLRNFRCARDDKSGKKSLIGFLVRNNVLPKYGFPVDTVELILNVFAVGRECVSYHQIIKKFSWQKLPLSWSSGLGDGAHGDGETGLSGSLEALR